ncbi:MAG: acyl-CoA thioesterase [Candidatus Hydrogenedentes bacterium]|nr:acyl-CoA thioesterase [Candidatus Hydrogenedentota bacterium]
MRDRFKVWTPVSVRWGDMDAYGHVNNAVFFTYFECGRIAYFERLGIKDRSESNPVAPALASATINFRQQLHFPAELEVGIRVTKIGRSSFGFEHILVRTGTEDVIADGTSVIVYVDYRMGKSTPIPDHLRDLIRMVEGEEFEAGG